ncbi:MAG: hypothetical protein KGI79_02955 [Patescibacteria group bacterium]|nr:hypothetical protein [Patescibacteria group bacterium]MDE2116808.1 hypothetical protein [Patescibacteria group bacterium]
MFSFFREKPETNLVFRIGSASVGAGLVRFEQDKPPHLIEAIREPIAHDDIVDSKRLQAAMLSAFQVVGERAIKKARLDGLPAIGSIFLSFSSPWVATTTKIITIKGPQPFTLTRGHIDRIISADEEAFQKGASRGLFVIERRVLGVKPYDEKTRAAEISLLTSAIPTDLYREMIRISSRFRESREIKTFSLALAAFSIIASEHPEMPDFIFIDVGGEVSEAAIVRGGIITETASFPVGRHSIIRSIRKALGATAEETASLIRLYEEGDMDRATAAHLKPALDRSAHEWRTGFDAALAPISSWKALPLRLYAAIENDLAALFRRLLKSDELPLETTIIDAARLRHFVSSENRAIDDVCMAIASAFAGMI